MKRLLLTIGVLLFLSQSVYAGTIELKDVSGTPSANAMYSESIVKGWVKYDGATNSAVASFNVSSVTDNGTGDFTINWDRDFASTYYVTTCMSDSIHNAGHHSFNAAWLRVNIFNTVTQVTGDDWMQCIALGDQ